MVAGDPAVALVAAYQQIEDRLLTTLAKAVEVQDADAEDWARRKRLATSQVRTRLAVMLARHQTLTAPMVAELLQTAYTAGSVTATSQLGVASRATVGASVAREVADLQARLAGTHRLALVRAVTVYQQTTQVAAAASITGAVTRQVAAQAALTAFAQAGITGYTDRAGRSWELSSYVEMATRNATARTQLNGLHDTLIDNGRDLVVISDSPDECGVCRDWEREVVSLTGATPGYPTLDEAESDGLFHPGCTHSTRLYLPGVTPRRVAKGNPDGYKDRQKLRALERQSRKADREGLVAGTPEAKQAALAKRRNVSTRIAEHTATTSQPRQRGRETAGGAR